MKSLVSISDLSREEIVALLDQAAAIKLQPPAPCLRGKLMACCFFEPSTRTRLSFEAAMKRLGGEVIGFSDAQSTSMQKGETLHDTLRVIDPYCDLLVIRHPREGAARFAQELVQKPVINAGDGSHQHPSQTLLDLFTIRECQGKLDELHLGITGDLRYGRTVHSLVLAASHFGMRLYFVSSEALTLPPSLLSELKQRGVKFSFHRSLDEVIDRLDVLYMTRVQKERFAPAVAETMVDLPVVTPALLERAKGHLKILHPLPRLFEIPPEIDATPQAHYFQQAHNAVYVRQALILHLLQAGG